MVGIPATLADGLDGGRWDRPGCSGGTAGRRGPAPGPRPAARRAADAEVRIAFGAGRLLVGPAASGRLVDGTFNGAVDATPARPGRVRLATPRSGPWSWSWGRPPFAWRIGLTAEVPLRLELETGASDNELDLGSLRVTDLRLRTGAAQSRVTLPATGVTRVDAESGAAQLRFRVPAGVAARITSAMAIGTTDVEHRSFPTHAGRVGLGVAGLRIEPEPRRDRCPRRRGPGHGRLIRGRRRGAGSPGDRPLARRLEPGQRGRAIEAIVAPASRTRSPGASSTCNPRRPPLT